MNTSPSRPPSLRWPPPGLERLQGDLLRVASRGGLSGGFLVLPMLFVIAREQAFSSLGPFADAWWVSLVLATVGLGFALDAITTGARILERTAQALRSGYDLRTVLHVIADARRDTGFLLQGSRHFSTMEPRERKAVGTLRMVAAGCYAAAGLWLPVVLGVGLLVAARGGLGYTGLWAWTLVPAGALYLTGAVLLAVEDTRVRRARALWFQQPWASDLVEDEIGAWRAELGALRGEEVLHAGGAARATLLRRTALGVGFLSVIVAVPVLTLVSTSAIGPVLALVALPRFEQVQQRAARVEAFRGYRLAPDSSVSPQEAGGILQELAYVGLGERTVPGERNPVRRFADAWPIDLQGSNPVGSQPNRWPETLFERVADDPSPELLAYLRQIADHPAQEDYARLSRAAALDAASGRWEEPFPEGSTMASVPIPRFSGLRESVYARLAAAAVDLAEKHPDRAEEKVREVISVGFLLGDDGPTLIENLVGNVMVDNGATALAHLYRVTGRTGDADHITELRSTAERAATRVHGTAPKGLEALLRYLPETVTDTTAVRGLRWEFLTLTTTLTPCINLNRMVFGTGDEYRAFLDRAHDSLVQYPSEEPLFDLARAGYWGAFSPANESLLGRLLAVSMRSGEGTCADVMRRFDSLKEIM